MYSTFHSSAGSVLLCAEVCNLLFSKFDLIFTKIDNLPEQIAWQICIFADLFRRFSRAVQCCDILQMLEVTTLDETSTCNHSVSQHLESIKPVSLWLFFSVKYRMHPTCRIPCTHRCPYLEFYISCFHHAAHDFQIRPSFTPPPWAEWFCKVWLGQKQAGNHMQKYF